MTATGRDRAITVKALAYAIVTIEALPDIQQEWSDCEDMRLLLKTLCPSEFERQRAIDNARLHLQRSAWLDGKSEVVRLFPEPSA